MIFLPGTYKHKSGITVYIDNNGVAYIKGDIIPLTIRTNDIFNNELWEVLENGSTNP